MKQYRDMTDPLFAIITENDESNWKDKTGSTYHFPKRYEKYLTIGTKLIYYKGKLKKSEYKDKRLSIEPHYFGIGVIDSVRNDPDSLKNDLFASIKDFTPFLKAVIFKQAGTFIENIPSNRISNYWRDGVRQIDKDTYNRILQLSDLTLDGQSQFNDLSSDQDNIPSYELIEGATKHRLATYYERNPVLRQQALLIHGYSRKCCGFNFSEHYGKHGEGFIEIHHIEPISEAGEKIVNPRTDLVPLCSNCHSIIHRQKGKTLTVEELKISMQSCK